MTKIFCSNSFLHHQSGAPFINSPVVPQGFDRKSCVTQAARLSASTFPLSSIGNAYLRKSAYMFRSALPTPTAMPLLEMSTGQLTVRAAAATHKSFPSVNYPTSDGLSQGKKNPQLLLITCGRATCPRVRMGWLPWGTLPCSRLSPPNIPKRRQDLPVRHNG